MTSEVARPTFWRVFAKANPWIWIPLFLWLTQVWAIWDSDFTMEVTMLQLPFVMAFQVVIFLIARERIVESGASMDEREASN